MLDIERLLESLNLPDAASLNRLHREGIDALVEQGESARQAHWTEAVVVGGRDFVARVKEENTYRRAFSTYSIEKFGQPTAWVIKETGNSYMGDFGGKSGV